MGYVMLLIFCVVILWFCYDQLVAVKSQTHFMNNKVAERPLVDNLCNANTHC